MKIKIVSDSVCDLSPELIEKYDVGILPLHVILGEKEFRDGVDITPHDIFAYVKDTGNLPKTSACTTADYEMAYSEFLKDADAVIFFSISSKCSSTFLNASTSAEKFDGKVFCIDSENLSTGQGLLVLKACDLRDQGLPAEEIVQQISELRSKVQTSFVVDTTEYLYKGGRCTAAARVVTQLLSIHPAIHMVDGELKVKAKIMGSLKHSILKYVESLRAEFPHYDETRVFITHTYCDEDIVERVKKVLKEKFHFQQILETKAGSCVTSHCGQGTLGVLFIRK